MENSILDKIKKLYIKAQSTHELGNLKEAEAFLQKVTELCLLYNFEISQIESHQTQSEKQNIITQTGYDNGIEFGKIKSDGDWEMFLLKVICDYNFCKSLYKSKAGISTIIGTESNIEVTKWMYEFCYQLIKEESGKAYYREIEKCRNKYKVEGESLKLIKDYINNVYRLNLYSEDFIEISKDIWTIKNPEKHKLIPYRKVFVRSFLKGAVLGLGEKLKEKRRELENQNNQIPGLILVTNEKLENFVKETFENKIRQKSTRIEKNDALRKGKSFGESININPQLMDKKSLK